MNNRHSAQEKTTDLFFVHHQDHNVFISFFLITAYEGIIVNIGTPSLGKRIDCWLHGERACSRSIQIDFIGFSGTAGVSLHKSCAQSAQIIWS
jgi:hypothetical protein